MWTLGIDAGTLSWKACLMEGERIVVLDSFKGPEAVLDHWRRLLGEHPDLVAVLPSGFGIPVKRADEIDERDLFEMTLKREGEEVLGLGRFLKGAREVDGEAYCIPSVKLLPTVPVHRKLNKVDMGTSDKLCAVAYILWGKAGFEPRKVDFLALEVGYAHKALLAVKGSRIIDGIGSTLGSMGPKARGAIDGELAYLHSFKKRDIYSGGYLDLEERFGGHGREAFLEGLEKEVAMFRAFYGIGELSIYGRRWGEVAERLRGTTPQEHEGYEAAIGASMVANGLAGGIFKGIIQALELEGARERVLDWIYTPGT